MMTESLLVPSDVLKVCPYEIEEVVDELVSHCDAFVFDKLLSLGIREIYRSLALHLQK